MPTKKSAAKSSPRVQKSFKAFLLSPLGVIFLIIVIALVWFFTQGKTMVESTNFMSGSALEEQTMQNKEMKDEGKDDEDEKEAEDGPEHEDGEQDEKEDADEPGDKDTQDK